MLPLKVFTFLVTLAIVMTLVFRNPAIGLAGFALAALLTAGEQQGRDR